MDVISIFYAAVPVSPCLSTWSWFLSPLQLIQEKSNWEDSLCNIRYDRQVYISQPWLSPQNIHRDQKTRPSRPCLWSWFVGIHESNIYLSSWHSYLEVPAWILFHTILGYILLAAGLTAIILRFPIKPVQRYRWLHPYVGYVWVMGTIWMPITAIWCVYSFVGWDIIAFFIFSLYAWVFTPGTSADTVWCVAKCCSIGMALHRLFSHFEI